MPEIWLGYGSTDVVLDIKFENLANEVSPAFKSMSEAEAKSILESVDLREDQLILVLSGSKAVARIVQEIVVLCRMKGIGNISVDVPPSIASSVRSNLTAIATSNSQVTISVNRIDQGSYSISERLEKFSSAVAISRTTVDPLFGFAGAPTAMLRNFLPNQMAAAFSSRAANMPTPGVSQEPLKVALDALAQLKITQSIEVIAGGRTSDQISGMHIGSIQEAFSKSVEQLGACCENSQPKVRAAITSAGTGSESHSTLHSSLYSLWNSIPHLDDGGTAVLLAECRNGIGGGALQMCVEGKMKLDQFDSAYSNVAYTSGLEHLMYIRELGKKYDLAVVTSLPRYYVVSQLGFSVFGGAKEALESTILKRGKNSKVLVVPDGDLLMPPVEMEAKG